MFEKTGKLRIEGGKYALAIALVTGVNQQLKNPSLLTRATKEKSSGKRVYERFGLIIHKLEPLSEEADAFLLEFTVVSIEEPNQSIPLEQKRFIGKFDPKTNEIKNIQSIS